MTLKDFLAQPVAQDFICLVGAAHPERIPVDSISILEPPVEHFVRNNEILLSTALSVREDPEALFGFILDAKNAGAAAIVFALPGDDMEPLEEIREKLEKLGFPIITMPWSQLFSDVVEQTLKEIWRGEENTLRYLEEMQRQLLNDFIAGKSLNDAAELLAEYLESDIVILDMNHEIMGRNLRIRGLSPEGFLKSRRGDVVRLEILSGNHLHGFVLMSAVCGNTLHTADITQYITTPLSLWFDREWSIRASIMKSKEDFVWKLAHNEFESSQDAVSKADYLNFNTETAYVCVCGQVCQGQDDLSGERTSGSGVSRFSETVIEETVLVTARKLDYAVMTVLHRKRLIIFLEARDKILPSSAVESYLDALEQAMSQFSPQLSFLWGYDTEARPLYQLAQGYSNAKKALALCLNSAGTVRRSCFHLTLIQRVCALLRSDAGIQVSARQILQPLFDYDKNKESNYLETLRAYIHTNYNISETSRITHLHRQSLLYRLEKIETLCNLSLKNHEDLFLLELAVRMME